MIQTIIFSFNRALQLDTLITSMIENWQNPQYCIDIIYNTSDQEFQKGYDFLLDKYSKKQNICFHKESSIKDTVGIKELMNIRNFIAYNRNKKKFTPKSNFRSLCIDLLKKDKNEFVMFLTDDAMFIDQVMIDKEVFDWIKEEPTRRQFSLRMGKGMNGPINHVEEKGNYLTWDFHNNSRGTNWGYPFSVDAHVYHKQPIVKLFEKYIFCNPNTLEGFINAQVYRKMLFEEGRSYMKCKLLSYPINMVQTVEKNETLGVDCKMLNNLLLDGYTMKYPVPEKYDCFQQYPDNILLFKDGIESKKELKN